MPAYLRSAATEGVIPIALCRLVAVEIERVLVIHAVGINEVPIRLLIAEAEVVILVAAAQPTEGPMEAGADVFVLAGVDFKVSHRPSPSFRQAHQHQRRPAEECLHPRS